MFPGRTYRDICFQVDPETPWTAPSAHFWDSISVQDFIAKNCWTRYSVM